MDGAQHKLRVLPGGGGKGRPRGGPSGRAAAKSGGTGRKVGRPKSRLTSAIAPDSTEREVLVVLRAKLATRIDGDVPAHALDKLLRQFMNVDSRIRAIDAAAAAAAEEEGDEGDGDDDDGTWDPTNI